MFGHPTLLTGLSPEFTVRAREDSLLYCIPRDVALELLTRPEGVTFVARTGRDRLIQAARTMSALPDVRTQPVTSLVRSAPLFCEPDTTVREAARLMAAEGRSALLVKTRDGLGIVTDVDLRDRVVADSVSRDAPVSAVMTTPVKTVSADVTAPEASIEMMAAGVNHLPVVDARGRRRRHPVGEQPHDPRRPQPVRAAAHDPRGAQRGRPGRRRPPTCRSSSSTCSTRASTRRR